MISDPEYDETTDAAVSKFVNSIFKAVENEKNFEGQLTVEFQDCLNHDKTKWCNFAEISSNVGVLRVIPNFLNQGAMAFIVNIGAINAMRQEGFDEEYIFTEGNIYSAPISYSKENIETIAHFLTHKIDFSK